MEWVQSDPTFWSIFGSIHAKLEENKTEVGSRKLFDQKWVFNGTPCALKSRNAHPFSRWSHPRQEWLMEFFSPSLVRPRSVWRHNMQLTECTTEDAKEVMKVCRMNIQTCGWQFGKLQSWTWRQLMLTVHQTQATSSPAARPPPKFDAWKRD